MTGINATKTIRNLEFVNSFSLSSLAFLLFWFFFILQFGSGTYPLPPPVEERAVAKGFFASSTHPSLQNWVPMFAGLVEGSFASLQ